MDTKKFYASVKDVKVKNLKSGDKEVWIILSVVGADVENAVNLAKLSPEKLIKIEYENDQEKNKNQKT